MRNLRKMVQSPTRLILMEAHNGITAKLVEEAGFEAIWASGLTISASLGLRDCNEASWTQVVDVLEYMADAVDIPILLDGDTGYGNFNSVRRLVTKLEQRGVAGVCLEDKIFPKTNSFIDRGQKLASIEEFTGKIKAAKDTQRNSGFTVVARVEALIAGLGMEEALKRAHAYLDAGADAILMHSKKPDAREIMSFLQEWNRAGPVVVVPTTYPRVSLIGLGELGASNAIYANHTLRTTITALRLALGDLAAGESLATLEETIVPVKDIFALQNDEELRLAESRYLPVEGEGNED